MIEELYQLCDIGEIFSFQKQIFIERNFNVNFAIMSKIHQNSRKILVNFVQRTLVSSQENIEEVLSFQVNCSSNFHFKEQFCQVELYKVLEDDNFKIHILFQTKYLNLARGEGLNLPFLNSFIQIVVNYVIKQYFGLDPIFLF